MRRANVRIYRTAHDSSPWQVSAYLPAGKRVRKHFATQEKAKAFAADLAKQLDWEGAEGFRFTADRRAEFVGAVKRLAALGATLGDAVDFYAAHHAGGAAVPFGEAVDALAQAKTAANRRPRTIAALRAHLRAYGWHGVVKTVADVTPESAREWLLRRGIGARTRAGNRASLSVFCKFCRARGWMKGDPLAAIERPTLDPVNAVVLTPEQCARLMTAAVKVADGRCVRAVALRLLAGLRPAEVPRLREEDIRADHIRVAVGKVRGRRALRIVPISPTLRAWLDLYPAAPLDPDNWDKLWVEIRQRAGVKVEQDGLRKTWISYRLAEVKNEAQVAREAGNSPDIIYRHYYGLVEPSDVPRFGTFSRWGEVGW